MNVLINAALFQAVWFATVAGAGAGLWWCGLPVLVVFAIWQLRDSRWPRADVALLALGVLLGFAIDSLLIAGGWLRYATPLPSGQFAPVWILVLWAGFALTVNHSLAFLKSRPALALLFGALGGPLAYLGAARLFEAVAFTAPQAQTLIALAVAWAIAMPLLAAVAVRLVAREARPA
ncbi:MAG TPA: DUF2878 domain-containing protein [Pseudomonadota bacterium]|jgi:hypothetical protein|nr:DUF2878 domain-containing protein [Pseudomonadota bacterium]